MKNIICMFVVISLVVPAFAGAYDFTDTLNQTASIDVEYWTGEGDYETILVIDWNQAGDWTTASHAFGYRWDGTDTSLTDMLDAIDGNGGLDITMLWSDDFGEYFGNFLYTDMDGDVHAHILSEEGSFNYASTGDAYGVWGEMDWINYTIGDWQANYELPENELIVNGQLEGINATYYNDYSQELQALDVPYVVPEPASLALLSLGGLLLRRKK